MENAITMISILINRDYVEVMDSAVDGNLCKLIYSGGTEATISFVRNLFSQLKNDNCYHNKIDYKTNGDISAEFEFRKKDNRNRIQVFE